MTPNYKKIYMDLLDQKYPCKKDLCKPILEKENLEFMDVIRLNELIFNQEKEGYKKKDEQYRSYDKAAIAKILDYQKEFQLNNTQAANHFKMSRNTIAKWKKLFLV